MNKYYFTYGTNWSQLHKGGWTIVNADTEFMARNLFKALYGTADGCLPCAGVYNEEDFKNTVMYKQNSNLGHGCWEEVSIDIKKY